MSYNHFRSVELTAALDHEQVERLAKMPFLKIDTADQITKVWLTQPILYFKQINVSIYVESHEMTSEQDYLHRMTFGSQLVFLNNSLDDYQLSTFKLACSSLNISRQELDNAKLFTDIYQLVEQRFERPQDALSLVVQILERIGVSEGLLQNLKRNVEQEVCLENNLLMDLILTVAAIFKNLPNDKFDSLKEIARRTYFIQYNSANIKSRNHLLQMMLDDNKLTPTNFGFLYAWLEVVECSAQHELLRQYCKRQGIVEPDWEGLVPPLKG